MTINTAVINTLREELSCFARAGTAIEVIEKNNSEILVNWQFQKENRESYFRWRNATESWQVRDARISDTWISYQDFLASEHMADLRYLAQQIELNTKIPKHYLSTKITLNDDDDSENRSEPMDALEALAQQLDHQSEIDSNISRTTVLFLRGEAGTGKSVALRKFAKDRARSYLRGACRSLCLYVDAQGKALLNIHDAFSSTLDDLSVSAVRKDTVAVLCKHGLLVPLIDGFDELLGSGGYGEAFNSLSSFIAALQRRGKIITSGRSTFYDDQYLQIEASSLDSTDLDYHTTAATVEPWTEDQVREYCQNAWTAKADKNSWLSHLDRLLGMKTFSQLLRKPFFTAQVAELIPAGGFDANRFLVEQLVDGLLKREENKWKTTEGTHVFSVTDHYRFLQDVAEEMWWQRALELDSDTVRLLAEVLTSQLPSSTKNLVINRSATHAAFESERKNRVFLRFQHAVYFDFFLQRRIVSLLESKDNGSLLPFLERGLLTESTLELLAYACNSMSVPQITAMIQTCSNAMRQESRYQTARQNAGAIVAELLNDRNSVVEDLRLNWLIFYKANICNVTINRATLRGCEFFNAKLYGFRIQNTSFQECHFNSIYVDNFTHIDTSADELGSVGLIMFNSEHGLRRILIPTEKAKVLAKIGVRISAAALGKPLTKAQNDRIELLERFLRHMQRSYYFSLDLERLWGLSNIPDWTALKALLIKYQILTVRSVEKNGPVGKLEVLSRTPQQIREGVEYASCPDAEIANLWRELLGVSSTNH